MFGSVTRKKICRPFAPSTRAASSSSVPCACIVGRSSRVTNGNVTNIVAMTVAVVVCRILIPKLAISQSPKMLCIPNRMTKSRPAMTGETANGRSISEMSRLLPQKLNFPKHHADMIPNRTLIGTAMPTVRSVTPIARMVLRLVSAVQYVVRPSSNAQ